MSNTIRLCASIVAYSTTDDKIEWNIVGRAESNIDIALDKFSYESVAQMVTLAVQAAITRMEHKRAEMEQQASLKVELVTSVDDVQSAES